MRADANSYDFDSEAFPIRLNREETAADRVDSALLGYEGWEMGATTDLAEDSLLAADFVHSASTAAVAVRRSPVLVAGP